MLALCAVCGVRGVNHRARPAARPRATQTHGGGGGGGGGWHAGGGHFVAAPAPTPLLPPFLFFGCPACAARGARRRVPSLGGGGGGLVRRRGRCSSLPPLDSVRTHPLFLKFPFLFQTPPTAPHASHAPSSTDFVWGQPPCFSPPCVCALRRRPPPPPPPTKSQGRFPTLPNQLQWRQAGRAGSLFFYFEIFSTTRHEKAPLPPPLPLPPAWMPQLAPQRF